ncbi:DUF6678 family protein [Paenibacillus odorifer]|uniref:DUF6678 family protein n=1 Tax=Paenibacillus odorifer TaxID=189426 RepID=UPI0009D782D0|nr:DUF6678 family protein [Paenibacillus odorifer]
MDEKGEYMDSNELKPLMNNTKWEEIRQAMLNYAFPTKCRIKDIDTGYISLWDGDWYYHFSDGGYKFIEWLEIHAEDDSINADLIQILKKIHVPGEVTTDSIIIYGYNKTNEFIDYI